MIDVTTSGYYTGDCREVLRRLPDGCVQTCVTSPPFYGLRDYGTAQWEGGDADCDHRESTPARTEASILSSGLDGGKETIHASKVFRGDCQRCGAARVDRQLGLEATPGEYVAAMVEVFREVWRVLADDGTLWLNLGDSYAGARSGPQGTTGQFNDRAVSHQRIGRVPRGKRGFEGETKGMTNTTKGGDPKNPRKGPGSNDAPNRQRLPGLKPKDLIGIPWEVAFALRRDGWYLRSDIIWCLSGGAHVYARTQKGDMPVMIKDLVRLDPRTVMLWNGTRWTQVLGWGPSTDTSERIELHLRSGERVGCTGSHQWPTDRGLVAARDLVVGDVLQTCALPAPDCEAPGYLTDDLCWLIGLWLAEGCHSDNACILSLNADEEHWIPRIRVAVTHLGGTVGHTVNGNSLTVRMFGPVVRATLDAYRGGATSHDIHLLNAAWRLPNRCLRLIADGYLDGDGHLDAANGRYRLGFTRNYALERDLRVLAARLGATLTLHPTTATYQNGTAPAFRGEWRWERTGHHNEKDRSEILSIGASRARRFWDIAVEDEPHLFALASGVLTHNCKPNPMPESVADRPTKSHEYLFLLSKSETYYYNHEAIKEPCVYGDHPRNGVSERDDDQAPGQAKQSGISKKRRNGTKRSVEYGPIGVANGEVITPVSLGGELILEIVNGKDRTPRRSGNKERQNRDEHGGAPDTGNHQAFGVPWEDKDGKRNKRSVWTVATQPYHEAHFAVMPPALIDPCILAGSRPGDLVLDPFFGSGTTGHVAEKHGRRWIGIDLNPAYAELQARRTAQRSLVLP